MAQLIDKDALVAMIKSRMATNKHENPLTASAYVEDEDILEAIDTLEVKEPVSDDLEEASKNYALNNTSWYDCKDEIQESFKAGAKWQKENLWKSADGDDLPEIDREVIALVQDYPDDKDHLRVAFAHRPPEYWDGKDIVTGKVTRNYPKTYDKGGWNISNVKWWLDCSLPNLEEE